MHLHISHTVIFVYLCTELCIKRNTKLLLSRFVLDALLVYMQWQVTVITWLPEISYRQSLKARLCVRYIIEDCYFRMLNIFSMSIIDRKNLHDYYTSYKPICVLKFISEYTNCKYVWYWVILNNLFLSGTGCYHKQAQVWIWTRVIEITQERTSVISAMCTYT